MIRPTEHIQPDAHYSVDDTARVLGVSRWTIQRYTAKGWLRKHHLAVNNQPFYLGSELIEDIKKIV